MSFIRPMLGNKDKFKEIYQGSLQAAGGDMGGADFNKRMQSPMEKFKALKLQVMDLGLTLGEALLPAVTSLVNEVTPLVKSFGNWAKQNPQLISGAVKLTAGLVAFKLASAGLRVGIGLLLSPFAKLWTAVAKTRAVFALFGALRVSNIGRIASALQSLGMSGARSAKVAQVLHKLGQAFSKLGKAMGKGVVNGFKKFGSLASKTVQIVSKLGKAVGKGALNGFKKLGSIAKTAGSALGRLAGILRGRLVSGLRLMGRVLLTAARAFLTFGRFLIMNPIGLTLTAIAIAGYLIYKNWDKIAPVLKKVWNALKDGYEFAKNKTTDFIEYLANLPSRLSQIGSQMVTVQTGISLTQPQFNALISGLPWHNIDKEMITPII